MSCKSLIYLLLTSLHSSDYLGPDLYTLLVKLLSSMAKDRYGSSISSKSNKRTLNSKGCIEYRNMKIDIASFIGRRQKNFVDVKTLDLVHT